MITPSIGPVAICVALACTPLCVAQTDSPPPDSLMREMPGFPPPFWQSGNTRWGTPCDWALAQTLADVDGDGDLDLIIAPTTRRQARLLLNDGHGRLDEVSITHMPNLAADVWQLATGDIDGDGDVDLVTGNFAHSQGLQFYVFVNDGTGHFSDESALRLPPPQVFPYTLNDCMAMADFDGDGDLDLVRAGGTYLTPYQYSAKLLANDGSGHFAEVPTAFPMDGGLRSGDSGGLHAADLDGDGDVDLVGNIVRGGIAYWINDGTGHFTDGAMTRFHPAPFQYSFLKVEIADLDGDGDLDLVGARAYMRDHPLLFLNDGTGHMHDVTATHIPVPSIMGPALQFGDFDDDGDLDFVSVIPPLSTAYPGEEMTYLNDGTAHFTVDREHRVFPHSPTGGAYELSVADLDGDGDVDVIIPNIGAEPLPPCRMRYLSNTLRHVYAPEPPTRGALWRVVVYGPAAGSGVLAISPRSGSLLLPSLGRLAVDPATAVIWPGTLRFGADRNSTVIIPIPNLPALAGRPLYAQAMVADQAGNARLTNLWSEPSIR